MSQKYWEYLKLKNGDEVHFVPPSPDGERLGGVTATEKSKINTAIQGIKAANTTLTADATGSINIPIATGALVGLVRSSTADDFIRIAEDGTMTLNSINVQKLYIA